MLCIFVFYKIFLVFYFFVYIPTTICFLCYVCYVYNSPIMVVHIIIIIVSRYP